MFDDREGRGIRHVSVEHRAGLGMLDVEPRMDEERGILDHVGALEHPPVGRGQDQVARLQFPPVEPERIHQEPMPGGLH